MKMIQNSEQKLGKSDLSHLTHLSLNLKDWPNFLSSDLDPAGWSSPFLQRDKLEEKEEALIGLKREGIQVNVKGQKIIAPGEQRDQMRTEGEHQSDDQKRMSPCHNRVDLPRGVKARQAQAHCQDGVISTTKPEAESTKLPQIRFQQAREGSPTQDLTVPKKVANQPKSKGRKNAYRPSHLLANPLADPLVQGLLAS